MKILKILLPVFPNNDYLQKHWWHRLVLVTATIISILSILAFIFFATAAILDYQEAQRVQEIAKKISLEEIYNIKPKETSTLFKPSSSEFGQAIKKKCPEYGKYSDGEVGSAALLQYSSLRDNWGEVYENWIDHGHFDYEFLLYMVIVLVLGTFVPSVVYITSLYIATGSKWKTD